MRAEAERERGPATPAMPALTLTGEQRRVVSEAISDGIAELQRAYRGTRVFGDQRRIQTRIDGLSRALGMVDRSGGRP